MTLKGIYDMSKYIQHYKIPEDLTGKTVLDAGSATGYFSFEFAKRGALKVVALDRRQSELQIACNMLLKTNVHFMVRDIVSIGPDMDKFDIVFCSNVLQHVGDIFGAIKALRKVTKEMAIISTDIMQDPACEKIPVAFFYGTSQSELESSVWSFWQPNMECFKKIVLKAGFSRVEQVSTFLLQSEDGKVKVRNGVLHAYP
jgi:ubiquinone/menaquinone biosynthesis C-methylase UbiE